jgi:hypothetical protein
MNLEHRPVYPRLHFLDLLPRFQQPIASEGFHAIHDIPFMVWIYEADLISRDVFKLI